MHSIEELEEAVKIADPKSLVQWGAWLGARFDEKQEKWVWLDGSSWDWESWDEGQPNRTCGRECGDCLRLNTTSWKLRTFRCSRSTNFSAGFLQPSCKEILRRELRSIFQMQLHSTLNFGGPLQNILGNTAGSL